MHGRVNVSILYVLMFCDIGSDGMDSTVLNSSRVGQFLKRLNELVLNSAFSSAQNAEFQFDYGGSRLTDLRNACGPTAIRSRFYRRSRFFPKALDSL